MQTAAVLSSEFHKEVAMRRVVPWLVGLLLVPAALHAQSAGFVIPAPPLLPNYERLPVGEREALESGAFIARTSDANANWYNPAGLALVERTGANLSANAYEATTLEIAGRRRETSSFRLSPISAFFGLAIAQPLTSSDRLRYGIFIAQPVAWQSGVVDELLPLDPGSDVAFRSEANLTRFEPGLAIGYRMNDRLRLGGSLGVSVTTLDVSQDIALRTTSTDSAATTRRTLGVDGMAWHLVPRIGMQWEASERWRIGAVASAPGLQMLGSATASLNAARFSSEGRYADLSFRDEEAEFKYEIPFSAGVGIAWTYARGSIEGAVRYYGSSESFDMLTTEVDAQLVDAVGGAPPAFTSLAAGSLVESWRGVTNVALGGNYEMSPTWRLHFGFNTDSSPVEDPENSIFRQVNSVGGTAGVSYQGETFGGTLGLGYSTGDSDPIGELPSGDLPAVETRLKVNTFRAMYSFSARF
jgi:long-subunit fatty acid transport protein